MFVLHSINFRVAFVQSLHKQPSHFLKPYTKFKISRSTTLDPKKTKRKILKFFFLTFYFLSTYEVFPHECQKYFLKKRQLAHEDSQVFKNILLSFQLAIIVNYYRHKDNYLVSINIISFAKAEQEEYLLKKKKYKTSTYKSPTLYSKPHRASCV